MKLALKSALFSSLVYPGAGHFILKKYVACVVLASTFSLPLLLILSDVVSIAQTLITQIETGKIPLDVIEIQRQLLNRIDTQIMGESNSTLLVLGLIWAVGIIDSYRIGNAISEHS